ncbi:cell envelope integrity protein CreD [Litoribacillus peritrichatus]|uniref:Cell envelope integrity protein CreD n=1 Tax=Litoribacillus peritrichatus TaxID=718191 RepID=A0ABP7MTU4_9GAMM
MQKVLAIKVAVIGLIALILLIPLAMISDKIFERSNYLYEAKNSVARSWTGSQHVMGPLIVIPYQIEKTKEVWNKEKTEKTTKVTRTNRKKYLLPEQVRMDANIVNDVRFKGIYKVPVYTSRLNVQGEVDRDVLNKLLKEIETEGEKINYFKPYLTATVSDPRGINSIPKLDWMGQELAFEPGSKLNANNNGIHAYLPEFPLPSADKKIQTNIPFQFELELRGMEEISFVPVGQEAIVSMDSDWPHPEFTGLFLPANRTISDSGYQAEWKITSFASNIADKVEACQDGNCNDLFSSGFGVKHIETVDVYLQSERSVKYGILFIGLSFIAFFIFEVIRKLPIHAIQYTLVGFAIAVFYLLLVSLSEHLDFALSYLIATLCCAGLLLFYLRYVLRGFTQALMFSGLLLLLYGVLYVIISAEDFALLMGAFLTFVTLTIVMISTRNIDWYDVGGRVNPSVLVDPVTANSKPTSEAQD